MTLDLRIGKVAAMTGLNVRTIRYYEQVGVLPKPRRNRTGYASAGYRLYSNKDVDRLRLIKGSRLLDLSLAEIKRLLPSLDGGAARSQLDLLLRQKLAALDDKIRDLELLRDRLGHIKDVLAQEKVAAQENCCDPLCGPHTCPPPLVKLGRRRQDRGKTIKTSDRRYEA